ncbi:heterokaryon incompatibility protein-domain-containing protein [Hyaloscypha sp. PMI_1271]|nr:heterokaryon incompatibility protein-domain-containing protein [Hyaloscypha sp. PMI_1271]
MLDTGFEWLQRASALGRRPCKLEGEHPEPVRKFNGTIPTLQVSDGTTNHTDHEQRKALEEHGQRTSWVSRLLSAWPPAYQYNILDPSTSQIRLFRLAAPQKDGYIRGSLETFDLEDTPPFYALSYVWGPRHPSRSVHINGYHVKIRHNLYNFFQCFGWMCTRETIFRASGLDGPSTSMLSFDTYLWIDQLCINQQSIEERNHQVQRMSQIYQQAEQAIAWLGADSERIPDALRATKKHVENSTEPDETMEIFAATFIRDAEYWKRLWVVQELLLAKDVTLMSGTACLKWQQLEHFCFGGGGPNFLPSELCHRMHIFLAYRHETYRAQLDDFTILIRRFSTSLCADPRDKVYALLGMLSSRAVLVPDYAKSVQQVFDDAVEYAVSSSIFRLGEKATWHFNDIFEALIILGAEMGLIENNATSQSDHDRARLMKHTERVFEEKFELYKRIDSLRKSWYDKYEGITPRPGGLATSSKKEYRISTRRPGGIVLNRD